LTEEQYKQLKQVDLAGGSRVYFDDMMISIPHISKMEKMVETITEFVETDEDVVEAKVLEELEAKKAKLLKEKSIAN
jgi:hypothetical protein